MYRDATASAIAIDLAKITSLAVTDTLLNIVNIYIWSPSVTNAAIPIPRAIWYSRWVKARVEFSRINVLMFPICSIYSEQIRAPNVNCKRI